MAFCRLNFTMTIFEMFSLWQRYDNNDLETIIKEQFIADITYGGFTDLMIVSNADNAIDKLSVEEKNKIYKAIDQDVSQQGFNSKFFQAIEQIDSDFESLSVEEVGSDGILNYCAEIDIDLDRLVELYKDALEG